MVTLGRRLLLENECASSNNIILLLSWAYAQKLRTVSGSEQASSGDDGAEGSSSGGISSFRPEFVEQLAELRAWLLGKVPVKQIYGQRCTAGMLAALAGQYLAAINRGAVPSIRKSWEYVVDQTLADGHANALRGFDAGVDVLLRRLPPVLEWEAEVAAACAQALASFDAAADTLGGSVGQVAAAGWRAKLSAMLAQRRLHGLEALHGASAEHCEAVVGQLLPAMIASALSGGGGGGGGKEQQQQEPLCAAVQQLVVDYRAAAKGPAADTVLAATLASDVPAVFGAALGATRKQLLGQSVALAEARAGRQTAEAELVGAKEALGVETLWRGNLCVSPAQPSAAQPAGRRRRHIATLPLPVPVSGRLSTRSCFAH
eukprot:SAG22_NODE_423_length_10665_cov_7.110543_7_plen_374_part_00